MEALKAPAVSLSDDFLTQMMEQPKQRSSSFPSNSASSTSSSTSNEENGRRSISWYPGVIKREVGTGKMHKDLIEIEEDKSVKLSRSGISEEGNIMKNIFPIPKMSQLMFLCCLFRFFSNHNCFFIFIYHLH